MAFATTTDVSTRLGRDLTATEDDTAEYLLDAAAAVIGATVDMAVADLDAETVPVLKYLSVDLVCRALRNPEGIASYSEQLGSYQRSQTFANKNEAALSLTKMEQALLRRAVHGQLTGSSRPESTATELYDVYAGS